MNEITIQFPPIIDPRSLMDHEPWSLADRFTSLAKKRLLFFDNGKLGSHDSSLLLVFHTVVKHFREHYATPCQYWRHNLSHSRHNFLSRVPKRVMTAGFDAVILALCDTGTTAHMVVLAWELERHGIPTMTLCEGQSIYVAAAMSLSVMPGLPLGQLNLPRRSVAVDIAAEALWIQGEVLDALTTEPAILQKQFIAHYAPDTIQWPRQASRELPIVSSQRFPVAGLDSTPVAFDPTGYLDDLYEAFCQGGMCDGLPIMPPTRPRVQAMLKFTDRNAEEILIERCFPSGLPLTVEGLAINAVMAGCRPEYFPLLFTAAQAIADPAYNLLQGNITSHPACNAILVSGPLAEEIGLASSGGCLGPGFRANMTIGRALYLSLLNTARALPARADLAAFGSPAELTFCCAENIHASPWTPWHRDVFDAHTTAVTVMKCEAPHNVVDQLSTTAESLLRSIADVAATLGGNNAYIPAELLILLNPGHAHFLADQGWGKGDVQRYLYEQARNPRPALVGRGMVPKRPTAFEMLSEVPVVRSPADVLVFVAGAWSSHSMVGIPWGYAHAVTKAVTLKDGAAASCLLDFTATR